MRSPRPAALPESIAAVDLGSNSFHLVVARLQAGEPVVVDRLREMVQLAAGLNSRRRLDARSRGRALDCLRRFGQRLRHMPAESVRAVGTNTLRVARDAKRFLAEAEAALGHPIDTISDMEEARLIYLGVAHSLPDAGVRRLVVDIGGGSTEVIVGESFRPIRMASVYLGCVTLGRAQFAGGEIDEAGWRRAELAALREFGPLRSTFRGLDWRQAVGASGTVHSIAAVVRESGWGEGGITPKALRKLRDALLRAGHVERIRLAGLNPERRPVLPGGAVLLLAALETLEIEELHPAHGALREGLLYDLLGRIRAEDVRDRSVAALADRYHADRAHGARVAASALELFDQVAGKWELLDEDRLLLGWAAELHEIGLDIAHRHYHKHGAYVVARSDLFGFTLEEQRLLATLVRAQRRRFPAAHRDELPRRRARQIERLCILLRLAVVLHRSRSPDPIPTPRVEAGKKRVRLAFAPGWLAQKPLTRADLEQERDRLSRIGVALEFE